jgi:hypothetical protein
MSRRTESINRLTNITRALRHLDRADSEIRSEFVDAPGIVQAWDHLLSATVDRANQQACEAIAGLRGQR